MKRNSTLTTFLLALSVLALCIVFAMLAIPARSASEWSPITSTENSPHLLNDENHLPAHLRWNFACYWIKHVKFQKYEAFQYKPDAPARDPEILENIPSLARRAGINATSKLALRVSAPQDFQRGYRRWGGRRQRDPDDRGGVPLWKNDEADPGDVFTFVRIQWSQGNQDSGRRRRRGFKWHTDYPDADLNLSYRLQQLTSIKTDPHGKILKLTDEELFKYPFIYIIEPGSLVFSDAEVVALRSYLERGGFLMVDDFWGEAEWANFEFEMKRVFPDRPIEDIPLEHEIFNIVYKIKKKPLIPSVYAYQSGNWTERWDAREPHYRCVKDDSGRLMTVICHNTDLGDGWEQEGADSGYFEEYSEPYAYPLGINIVTYAMTH